MKPAFILCLMLALSGCGEIESPVSSVQSDLDHNPKLRDKGYTVSVRAFDHGYVTLAVKGLSERAAYALEHGDDLMTIAWATDGSVSVLVEAEGILKKRQDVKGVKWVALKS